MAMFGPCLLLAVVVRQLRPLVGDWGNRSSSGLRCHVAGCRRHLGVGVVAGGLGQLAELGPFVVSEHLEVGGVELVGEALDLVAGVGIGAPNGLAESTTRSASWPSRSVPSKPSR